jgi:hypothetical protein
MKKATEIKPPEKTRRVQLWEILEGPHSGEIAVYYIDLQTYDIKVQNAVLLYPWDATRRRPIDKPFLQRVGTRGYIKKTFYEEAG